MSSIRELLQGERQLTVSGVWKMNSVEELDQDTVQAEPNVLPVIEINGPGNRDHK